MSGEPYSVILFYSSSYALRTEKILSKEGISCKMIPVPRHLSSDCGVCIRILQTDREASLARLAAAKLPVVGVHDL